MVDQGARPWSPRCTAPVVLRCSAFTRALCVAVDGMDIINNNKTVARIETYGLCIMRDQAVGLLLNVADELGVPIYWQHKLLRMEFEFETRERLTL